MPTKTDVKRPYESDESTQTQEAEPLSIIGKPVMKVDAMAKVVGETMSADDLALPRMLFCKLKRSPHPHARIVNVDTSKAEAMPGVVAALVGAELPIPFGILPVSEDELALCIDKTRFVGDPVAAVAAVDEETAEAALDHIDVEYEVLQPIMSIEDALREDSEPIHAGELHKGRDDSAGANVHKAVSLEFGDLEEGSPKPTSCARTRSSFRATHTFPRNSMRRTLPTGPTAR